MKQKRTRYDPEFKEMLVLASYEKKCTTKLEKEYGLGRGMMTRWRQELEKSGSKNFPAGYFIKQRQRQHRTQKLEKKINNAEEKFKILKNAGCHISKEQSVVFSYILANEKTYTITMMCKVLNADRTAYHNWKRDFPSDAKKRRKMMKEKIIEAFYIAEQRYGAKRIAVVLQNDGVPISPSTVRRYMAEMGLHCNIKKDLFQK